MFGNGHVQFQGECGGAILQSYPTEGSNPLDLSDYVFVSKQLFLRMTIIDIKTKLIIAEKLVNEEEYNDQTIKDFLENNINTETLKSITTDGRKNYKTIISAIGAIHHRCFFHLMQNLMTPLQKHVNKLERKIKTNTKKITKNKEEIERRKQKYTPHKGRIPLKDTKRQNNKNKIKELTDENKKIRQENRNIKKELQTIQTNKERIQKIFKSKTLKQATRRFNTIYNNRKTLHHTFQTFLENMNKDLDLFLNHIENKDIPATNNTVENYYRTTLPRKHKRIYRTLKGLQKRIKQQQLRWTHRQVLYRKDNIDKNTKYN